MRKPFFVMLNCQRGGITPMEDDDGELATFSTEEDAGEAAKDNTLGFAFGYEIFESGRNQ